MWRDAHEAEQPQIQVRNPALRIQPQGLPPHPRAPHPFAQLHALLVPVSSGRETQGAAAGRARERRGLRAPLPETPACAVPVGTRGQSCSLREEAPAPHQDSELRMLAPRRGAGSHPAMGYRTPPAPHRVKACFPSTAGCGPADQWHRACTAHPVRQTGPRPAALLSREPRDAEALMEGHGVGTRGSEQQQGKFP